MSTEWCDVYSRTVLGEFCGFILSIRGKPTLQELEESCFIPTVREKLLKNTLIFRPTVEHQWARNQAVTSSKETLLSSCTGGARGAF